MRLLLRLGIPFLCIFFSAHLIAQCDPPELLPTEACEVAPAICLTGACYNTLDFPYTPDHFGFCGGFTTIHNPQYVAFTVTDSTVQIVFQVGTCSEGSGLQFAIIDTCVWDETNVLDCNGFGTGPGGTYTANMTSMNIDSVYYIVIDGSATAICNYEIISATGVAGPPINGDLSSASTPDLVVCQGQDSFTASASPAIPDAPQYEWTLPWGDFITSVNSFDIEVPEDATLGLHTVCVTAFSGCDTVDTKPCFTFTVEAVNDIIKTPQTFCPEEFPFNWHGESIAGAGVYRSTFDNAAGCPFDSVWTVSAYPAIDEGLVDTVHCGITVDYESVTYAADGVYDLFYPDQGLNGCDSSAKLNVTLVDLRADLDFTCENGEFVISPLGLNYQPAAGILTYQWFENAGVTPIIGETDPQLLTVDGGSYSLMITVTVNGESCEFNVDPIVVNPAELVPDAPEFEHGDTIICPNVLVDFMVINDDPDITEYIWNGPTDLDISDDGSGSIVVDFSGAGGTSQICVFAVNDCGQGPSTCFDVALQQIPTVGIDAPNSVCVDSIAEFVFAGDASSIAAYLWDFDSGTIVTGPANGIGEGPYEVSWNTPGDKNVTIKVAEVGCDTISYDVFIVVEQMEAPVVSCTSTIESITFFWDPLAGVSEYLVDIPGGITTSTSDTFMTITGLNPNDSLTLFISALGTNNCGSEVVTAGCSAESCATPIIQIIGADTICLNGADPTYDLNALVNGANTEGTWSGPGIVDAASGIFDPTDISAGPGTHQIIFTFVESPLCTFTQNFTITVLDLLESAFLVESVICIDDASSIGFTGIVDPDATYNWNFDNGTVISGSNAGPYEIEWGSPGIKQVSLTVRKNGCVSAMTTRPVEVQPTLNPPIVSCTPNTTFVEFSWNDVVSSSGFVVSVLQGPAGVQAGNFISFDGLVSGDSVMIEIVTLSATNCPNLIDTFLCVARTCPSPIVTLSEVPPICLDENTPNVNLMVDVQFGNGSGMWSGNGVIDPIVGIFQPDAADAGVGLHPIVYTYNDDGCTFVNSINIDVFETPSAIISNTALTLNCSNGNEIILDGSTSFPGNGLIYEWSVVSGSGQFINGNGTALATINTEGTYRLRVTTPDGCTDSTQIMVTQDAGSPTADAGLDDMLSCATVDVEIGGASSSSATINYQWVTSDGTISSDPTLDKITVESAGTYTIMVTDEANGCVSMDDVVVGIDTARAILSIENPEMLDCDTESLMLNGQVMNGITNVSSLWTTDANGNILSGVSTFGPIINSAGIYTMQVTNEDNGCKSEQAVEVFVDDDVITDFEVMVTDAFCNEEASGQITLQTIMGGTEPFSYSWSNGSEDMDIQELRAGDYSLIVTDANGCSFEKSFVVSEPNRLSARLTADLNQYVKDDQVNISLEINQDMSTISDITYQYDGAVLCQNSLTCSFVASTSDSLFVLITDENGCTTSGAIFIPVIFPKIVYVPNTFTPNGDGSNDFFNIFAKDIVANIEFMEIYSRWGEQLFYRENVQVNNQQDGWNGEVNGTPVAPGVYVYRMKINYSEEEGGDEEILKGDITLLR